MGLRGYIAKRSINTLILIFFVINLNFMIFLVMPGEQSAISGLAGNPTGTAGEGESPADRLYRRNREIYGLDKPLLERWWTYITNLATFNFGLSFETFHPVQDDMIRSGRLVNTLILLGSSTVLSLVIGIFLGVIAAHRRGGIYDSFSVVSSLTMFSLPSFWIGIVLLLIFNSSLGLFPGAGTQPFSWTRASDVGLSCTLVFAERAGEGYACIGFTQWITSRLWYATLPVLTLTLFFYGGNLLLTRAVMLETLSEDYITTARAKGLGERTVLFKHALKNASLPLVTSAALSFGFLLSGAIITETVFTWEGLGRWIFSSIGLKDFPVLSAMFYIIALTVIIANFIADLIYGVLDPRIRYD